ncbi:phosphorylase family protein [Sporosarcina sp. FA15]|uniref:phosphorylase family protein n=1 Tax=Sporosarcina sp. FA15 TaxID=3413031 RepID=UPI003F656615
MIKVLIVEDNEEKYIKVSSFIKSHYSEVTIKQCTYLNNARVELINEYYDLLILDIQLPEFENQGVKEDAGLSLLQEIQATITARRQRRNGIKSPSYVLVLTAHDVSYKRFEKQFQQTIFKVAKYDGISDKWHAPLVHSIEHVLTNKQIAATRQKEFDYDLGIICALESELSVLFSLGWDLESERNNTDSSVFFFKARLNIDGKEIKVICNTPDHMGTNDTAIVTSKMIDYYKPRVIVMFGIAAGIQNQVNLGDIIFASTCYSHETGKYIEENGETVFLPTTSHVNASSNLVSIAKELKFTNDIFIDFHNSFCGNKPSNPPSIHIGPMSSGNAVIANDKILKGLIKNERKLLGVDMEIYGLYRACYLSKHPIPKFIAFKSVSDFADNNKNDDYHQYCKYMNGQIINHLISDVFISRGVFEPES